MFGKAYSKACKIETAINWFRKTGIFPLNENIFGDFPHAPSSTDENNTTQLVNAVSPPSRSTMERPTIPLSDPDISPSVPFIVPADVHPVPTIEAPSTSTRRGKAMIVTASPHKQEIMEAKKKHTKKEERVAKKNKM
ncbi:hypothetical protein Zmor_003580 [Zophobas morio]|uniref:Uncharacterized protein n=1 Tax=Zophobas morio TaxID=2755281 RepID=A0AA38HNI0_9CUCU|nr:hypothetical protein Zmor_003580 [Zophobas morio]